MRRKTWAKGPESQTIEMLNAALRIVQSVPYRVTVRWLFYRIFPLGYYPAGAKGDKGKAYKTFDQTLCYARYGYWNGWRPDTLADDTRAVIFRAGGYPSKAEAMGALNERLKKAAEAKIDHFHRQNNYIELWYEARAMSSQFKHYTKAIDLVPMSGQASFDFKWRLAKGLEESAEIYQKPIVVLYFGDEDLSGHTIQNAILEDVRTWSKAPFEFVRCGLTEAQAIEFDVPPNFEKQGYQWEGLPDEAAAKIIKESVARYVSDDLLDKSSKEGERVSAKCLKKVKRAIGIMGDET